MIVSLKVFYSFILGEVEQPWNVHIGLEMLLALNTMGEKFAFLHLAVNIETNKKILSR